MGDILLLNGIRHEEQKLFELASWEERERANCSKKITISRSCSYKGASDLCFSCPVESQACLGKIISAFVLVEWQ